MIDEESDLRRRFDELRSEEARLAPPFALRQRRAPRSMLRLAAVTLVLLIGIGGAALLVHSRRTSFSPDDHAAIRLLETWRAPTDSLLRPTGSEILTSSPKIPDLAGIGLPAQGAKP